jgi:hypothetical protein
MADLWYYTCAGKQMEPVTMAELQRLAAEGVLRPTDMVWKEGMARWVRASAAQELYAALPATPVVLAPAGAQEMVGQEEIPPAPVALVVPVPIPETKQEKTRPEPPKPARRPTEEERPRPTARRAEKPAEEERPRRRKTEASNSSGILIALGVGGGVLAIVLILAAVVFLFARARHPAPGPHANQNQGGFNGGILGQGFPMPQATPDLDIYIYDKNTKKEDMQIQAGQLPPGQPAKWLAKDSEPNQDCDINPWSPPRSDDYLIRVVHCDDNALTPHVTVRARVSIQELNPAGKTRTYDVSLEKGREHTNRLPFQQGTIYHVSVRTLEVIKTPRPAFVDNTPKPLQPEPLPADVSPLPGKVEFDRLEPGKDFVFKIQVPAGKKANISASAYTKRTGTSLQMFVYRERDNVALSQDAEAGVERTVLLPAPAQTEIYRVRIVNAGTAIVRGSALFTEQK